MPVDEDSPSIVSGGVGGERWLRVSFASPLHRAADTATHAAAGAGILRNRERKRLWSAVWALNWMGISCVLQLAESWTLTLVRLASLQSSRSIAAQGGPNRANHHP